MNNKVKIIGVILLTAAVSAGTSYFLVNKTNRAITSAPTLGLPISPVSLGGQQSVSRSSIEPVNFTDAAEQSVGAVVHVMTTFRQQRYSTIYEYFFGTPRQQQAPEAMGSGSGVILSEDGYIVTNNHVIQNADEISVTLNDKRTFKARRVGTDPSTDIALLKIEAKDLPTLRFGNSDDLKVGEWVLAVGNPFNLTSTVTAGIVSAKARNINILQADMRIESFIQTDAAVNPGNSGGALVNTNGELIGINTAIASRTGSYAGYSFAVPSAIVEKVVADLREYGSVQRAVLGVQIADITSELQQRFNLSSLSGTLIAGVIQGSAADKAGLKPGDIITYVEGKPTNSVAEFQEIISRRRPGDEVTMQLLREKKTVTVTVRLEGITKR